MNRTVSAEIDEAVRLPVASVHLDGQLRVPADARGIVLFAYGSGSSRFSPRNQFVAEMLRRRQMATLLFDLLTSHEEEFERASGHLRFDIDLLADPLVAATDWIGDHPAIAHLAVGYFGASTGGGAALVAAARRPDRVGAVVSRGGRPDLAREAFTEVRCATLLIVGGADSDVIKLNQKALGRLRVQHKQLAIVPGARTCSKKPVRSKQLPAWRPTGIYATWPKQAGPVPKERMLMVTGTRRDQTESEPRAELMKTIRASGTRLKSPPDLDPLLDRIGDARYVLLGEASHGTADYYSWRAEISKRLILEKGFSFIAVEGDWPDCYRVNRYVVGHNDVGSNAGEVLRGSERWPSWMWANAEVAQLVEWLRGQNERRRPEERVGFFGLDVYSLWDSLYAILGYLHRVDPSLLPAAWRALRCFEPYGEDVQEYARATRFVPLSCEQEVVDLLRTLRRQSLERLHDGEDQFAAEQNALVLKNAEAYFRAMVRGGPDSWNLRDSHMCETLERLVLHRGQSCKAIVWEHNTHIGDARYTDMVTAGEFSVGQLVRQRHANEGVVLVGFGSFQGTVIAGSQWEAPMQRMCVPPARQGSWEHVMHRALGDDRLLLSNAIEQAEQALEPRGHRAIGVVYRPQYERFGNYVPSVLPRRYEAFLYFDKTQALHPFGGSPAHAQQEVPQVYPSDI